MRHLFVAAGLFMIACATDPTVKFQKALSESFAENARITAQRDHYRDAATKAQGALEAAYTKGVKDGHATVVCQPSWPALEVKAMNAGMFKLAPLKAPGAVCDAGHGPNKKLWEAHCRGPIDAAGKCTCVRDYPDTLK